MRGIYNMSNHIKYLYIEDESYNFQPMRGPNAVFMVLLTGYIIMVGLQFCIYG